MAFARFTGGGLNTGVRLPDGSRASQDAGQPIDVPANTGLVSFYSPTGIQVIGWCDGPWTMTPEQYGGYASVDRTARRAVTVYQGVGQVGMAGSILLDGWSDQRAVTADCRNLEQMASPRGPGELSPPGSVRVTGSVPLPNRWWCIASLDPGDKVMLRASDGVRLRQSYEVVLVAPPTDAIIVTSGRRYVVRKGDTAQRVAASQLGKASRAREIRTADGKTIRDVRRVLPTGMILTLP
jgi:hypothetical protein